MVSKDSLDSSRLLGKRKQETFGELPGDGSPDSEDESYNSNCLSIGAELHRSERKERDRSESTFINRIDKRPMILNTPLCTNY